MAIKEITVYTNEIGAELVSAIMYDYSTQGVVIEDNSTLNEALSNSIYDYVDDNLYNKKDVCVKGYIENTEDIDNLKQDLTNLVGDFGSLEIKINDYQEVDYTEKWKEKHKVFEFENYVLCPEFLDVDTDKKVIKIKIGKSFGTGQHESTNNALKLVDKIDFTNKSVLDLGAGNGVLGLVAGQLGAKSVNMVELDEIEDAEYNIYLNNLSDKVKIKREGIGNTLYKCDILIMNMRYNFMIEYKEFIEKCLNDNAILVFSGVYQDAIDKIKKAYEKYKIIEEIQDGDWSGISFKKWN